MSDHTELVNVLRYCGKKYFAGNECKDCIRFGTGPLCDDKMKLDAAAAIEELQSAWIKSETDATNLTGRLAQAEADVERLKESNEELREKQTFIDHYGDKWMTSAKDVPTSAYERGYADGWDEAEAQLPKQGKWYTELFDGDKKYQCSNCLTHWDVETRYCPFCGAKMEETDDKQGTV